MIYISMLWDFDRDFELYEFLSDRLITHITKASALTVLKQFESDVVDLSQFVPNRSILPVYHSMLATLPNNALANIFGFLAPPPLQENKYRILDQDSYTFMLFLPISALLYIKEYHSDLMTVRQESFQLFENIRHACLVQIQKNFDFIQKQRDWQSEKQEFRDTIKEQLERIRV
jgi:hypothetical protein